MTSLSLRGLRTNYPELPFSEEDYDINVMGGNLSQVHENLDMVLKLVTETQLQMQSVNYGISQRYGVPKIPLPKYTIEPGDGFAVLTFEKAPDAARFMALFIHTLGSANQRWALISLRDKELHLAVSLKDDENQCDVSVW